MTASVSTSCPACGIIKKSGKTSCCGHGGSWFEDCGSAGNTDFSHTWHEGIRSCRTPRSPVVVEQKLLSSSFDDDSVGINSKAVVVTSYLFPSMPFSALSVMSEATLITTLDRKFTSKSIYVPNDNTFGKVSTPKSTLPRLLNLTITKLLPSALSDMSMTTSSPTADSASIITRDDKKIFYVVSDFIIVLIIACWCLLVVFE